MPDRAGTGVDVRRDYLLERGAGEAGDRWRVVDVFSLEEAAELVALRGRYVQQVAPGGMLSIRQPADRIAQTLPSYNFV